MKVNIWSDIRCPFCYIGKRKFEMALGQFPHREKVQVIWRSFQLDPNLKTQPDLHPYDYLSGIKGMSREQTASMHDRVESIGREVGLVFNFDNTVVANSFNGHRLIQLAKSKGLGSEAEEALFRAHFTDGVNIDDGDSLVLVGKAIGISEKEVEEVINSNLFADKVREDEALARTIGIRSVPFFLLNDRFSVSGAQDPQLFYQALHQAWAEYEGTSALT